MCVRACVCVCVCVCVRVCVLQVRELVEHLHKEDSERFNIDPSQIVLDVEPVSVVPWGWGGWVYRWMGGVGG